MGKGSDGVQCFIVGQGYEGARELEAVVQEFGPSPVTVSSLAQLRADDRFVAAAHALVLIAVTGPGSVEVAATIAFVQEQAGRVFLVCLAETISPEDYKRLVRTGSADWMPWTDYRDELRSLVARLDAAGARTGSAKIIGFLPSKGGVGNTTLAIETAIHLSISRKRRNARIALLELNVQGGTVADALDVEARFDLSEIVERPDRLDEQLVDVFTSKHSKGLDVFAIPMRRIGIDTVKPETIFTFIDAISARYDALLFDLPAYWLSWTDALLRGSDVVVVTGGDSVPALRKLAGSLAHLESVSVPAGKVAAAVVRTDTDVFGRVARRALIERALGARRVFCVRRDDVSAAEALDVGQSILELAPNARVSRDLRQVADWVDQVATVVPVVRSVSAGVGAAS